MSQRDFLANCVEWDVVNWSKAFKFWERNLDLNNKNYVCLELGARNGGPSIWLANKGNDVICSDLENPRETAAKLHMKYAGSSRISYQAIDATNIPYENHFDIVIFKSILGGISRHGNSHLKQVTIDQVHKALKPGGKLLFAENLAASFLHSFFRKKLTRWGSYWNYVSLNEIDGLFSKYKELVFETAGFLGAFGRNEKQRNALGRLDSLIVEKIAGERMRYIVFGIATKP